MKMAAGEAGGLGGAGGGAGGEAGRGRGQGNGKSATNRVTLVGQRFLLRVVISWLVMIMLSKEVKGMNPSQEEIEKDWIQSRGDVGEHEEGGEEYYLYYYDEAEDSPAEVMEMKSESGEGRLEKRENRSPFDFHQLSKWSHGQLISEAKAFCNCTTREETLALFDHVRLILPSFTSSDDFFP
jgi:hypothetical protein